MQVPTLLSDKSFHVIPRAGSDTLVIFFSGTGTRSGHFHFFKIAHSLGAHVILVNNGRNRWYQSGVPGLGDTLEETIKTLKDWADALGATKICTVGQSMGGYGAALYGSLLKADVLAFAFDTRLTHPSSRYQSHGLKDVPLKYPELFDIVPDARRFVMYVGENDPVDLFSAASIKHLPNVELTVLNSVDHAVVSYLHKRKGLIPLLEAVISRTPMPVTTGESSALHIPGFVEVFHEACCAFKEREWARVLELSRQTVALRPSNSQANYYMGRAYIVEGRDMDALMHFSVACALSPDNVEAHFYLGYTLRRLGQYEAALSQHKYSIERWPANIPPYMDMEKIYRETGQFHSAYKILKAAEEVGSKKYDVSEAVKAAAQRLRKHKEGLKAA